jgi:hypothetical protein
MSSAPSTTPPPIFYFNVQEYKLVRLFNRFTYVQAGLPYVIDNRSKIDTQNDRVDLTLVNVSAQSPTAFVRITQSPYKYVLYPFEEELEFNSTSVDLRTRDLNSKVTFTKPTLATGFDLVFTRFP